VASEAGKSSQRSVQREEYEVVTYGERVNAGRIQCDGLMIIMFSPDSGCISAHRALSLYQRGHAWSAGTFASTPSRAPLGIVPQTSHMMTIVLSAVVPIRFR